MILPVRFSISRLRRALATAAACTTILLLPACQIPKLRNPQQTAVLPATFNGAADAASSAQLHVEEFYQDPILSRLACLAVTNNRELKILEEEVQIARNEVISRSGAYLPMLNFGFNAGTTKYSQFTLPGASREDDPYRNGRLLPNPVPDFLGAFNLSWQIDIWRQLRNARDAARQRYDAAVQRRNYFITRIVAEVAEGYYSLMALDQQLQNLDTIIGLQEQSYKMARDRFDAGRGTELAVQRFVGEVRKNQSEKLIVRQEIIQVENRINFLLNRYPQTVERFSAKFLDLEIQALNLGVPAQLLQNRLDVREAERELEAAGLDVKVARARFFPTVNLTGQVGYDAFNPSYFFYPQAFVANALGQLVVPFINKRAIQADYMTANARQLQTVYNYQRVVLNAFTEVVNWLFKIENYRRSIDLKRQQLAALELSVGLATKLYFAGRVEYMDVLFAQRDFLDARRVLIQTKREQLTAVVKAYQALGGGYLMNCPPQDAVAGNAAAIGAAAAMGAAGEMRLRGPESQPLLVPRRQIEIAPGPRPLPEPKLPEKIARAAAPEPDPWVKAR